MEEVKEVVEDALQWDSNLFSKLFNMDVTPYVDSIKAGNANLKYLSWATAYQLLIPNAVIAVFTKCKFPLVNNGNPSTSVTTSTTAFGSW